jgi:hypothetical protein
MVVCSRGDAGALRQGQVGLLVPGETIELAGDADVYRVSEP